MKKNTLGIIGISALGLVLAGTGVAQAYGGSSSQNTSMTGNKTNFSQERRGDFQKIFDTTDYQTWKNAMSNTKMGAQILEKINENNFSRFVEMHKLLQAGDKTGAEVIRVELGLPEMGPGTARLENGERKGNFGKAQNEAVRTAIENKDFSAWKTAIAQMPNAENMLEKVNESNFAKLLEMHNLMQAGDRDGAEIIREDLDLVRPFNPENKAGMMRGARHMEKNTTTQN